MSNQSGLLNINKPPDMTSHAVVEVIRQETGLKRVGHAGTLDPFAIGVLIICLNRATRLAEYIKNERKTYNAKLRLGAMTNTYDRTGIKKLIRVKRKPTLEEVKNVLRDFIGPQEQMPPMYSARKVKGKKLYEYARQGKEVERKPAKIIISDIKLLEYKYPYLRLKVACSAGTYIRSIGHDIGIKLKTGAYVASLVRTRIGNFVIKDSIPLREINNENWQKLLLPSYLAVENLLRVTLDSVQIDQLKRGLPVTWKQPFSKEEQKRDIVCLSEEREVVAITRYDPDTEELISKKVLI